MTKTQKNLEAYVKATCDSFNATLKLAIESNWSLADFYKSLDRSYELCYGAILFAKIYEEKIDDRTAEDLRRTLSNARYLAFEKFYLN